MVEEILKVMEHRGIQHKEMAEMIGISESAFCNKANLVTDFTVSELEKMCDILGIKFQLFHTPYGWNIDAWRKKHAAETGSSTGRKVRRDCK